MKSKTGDFRLGNAAIPVEGWQVPVLLPASHSSREGRASQLWLLSECKVAISLRWCGAGALLAAVTSSVISPELTPAPAKGFTSQGLAGRAEGKDALADRNEAGTRIHHRVNGDIWI